MVELLLLHPKLFLCPHGQIWTRSRGNDHSRLSLPEKAEQAPQPGVNTRAQPFSADLDIGQQEMQE